MTAPLGFVVELGVKDLPTAIQFYTDLGAQIIDQAFDAVGVLVWAELEFLGSRLMLQRADALAAELALGQPEGEAKPSFALVVRLGGIDLAQRLYERLKAKYLITFGPNQTDYGTYEFAITDPDGYIVLLTGKNAT